ncbi:hypothetical protein FRC01_001739 [Tulasnella sp. 417]|nr:hypothetical protein FRC01_001739 [Tulasnella sp. 417]
MRNETLPRRGASLDSLARPIRATKKKMGTYETVESMPIMEKAAPVVSSPRCLLSQLHEEPEEAMDIDYPLKEREVESRPVDFTEAIRTAKHKQRHWGGKVSERNVLGLVGPRKENLLAVLGV